MTLGLLLSRGGIRVTVVEQHSDFRRDFRGDTVHPSTQQLFDDLGLWPQFSQIPAGQMTRLRIRIDDREVVMGDLSRLPKRVKHRCIAMVPQWDVLNLLAAAAAQEDSFNLRMATKAVALSRGQEGVVNGVVVETTAGTREMLPADLVIGCDGRWSVVRAEAGLELAETPVPMDVWWVRVPMRLDEQPDEVFGRFANGRVAVSMVRDTYHQVAYLIPKGSDAQLRQQDVSTFRQALEELFDWTPEQLAAITSWDDVKFLDVRMGLLKRWSAAGVLCIGDAAHPMSPVGGVGVNLAIQDAVCAASVLGPPLFRGSLTPRTVRGVERRRRVPVRIAQQIQRGEHSMLLQPALDGELEGRPLPVFLRILQRVPALTGLTAYVTAVGVRREPTPVYALD